MELSQLIKSTLSLYLECAVMATHAIKKNWHLIPASLIAYLIFLFAVSIFGGFGIAGGFIAGLFYIALLTFFYTWLRSILRKEQLRFNTLFEFDWGMFSMLISVGFLLWIFSMLTGALASTDETLWLYGSIQLGVFILLNALPEVIYIRGYQSTAAVGYTFNFIKDNWVEWFIPLLVLFLPILISQPLHLLIAIAGVDPFSAGADPLFPPRIIFSNIISYFTIALGWLSVLLAVALTDWFMLFRGFLFEKLDGSSRRQRAYLMKQK